MAQILLLLLFQVLSRIPRLYGITRNSYNHSQSSIEQLEIYIKKHRVKTIQEYRPLYHISSDVGLMQAPCGFSFYRGEYHLFYQFHPYSTSSGPMHWGHMKSTDLVHWKRLPTALIPDDELCLSGSAIADNNTMTLMYTGLVDNKARDRAKHASFMATSNNGVLFKKFERNPVISKSKSFTELRDPKIWEFNEYWYALIGATNYRNQGVGALYRSTTFFYWYIVSEINLEEDKYGHLWEFPDLFELNGKYILMMSSYVVKSARKTEFQTGYFIGRFSYNNYEFLIDVPYQVLDYGHDFYATQTLQVAGRLYLVAWFGKKDTSTYPEAIEGWAGALTMVRELKLANNRILMKPVDAMKDLRGDYVENDNWAQREVLELNKTAEITVENLDLGTKISLLFTGTDGGDDLYVKWDPSSGKVLVVRKGIETREANWTPIAAKSWTVFLDSNSVELFCGEGEVVFSSRVYPKGRWKMINYSPQSLRVKVYELKSVFPFDES